MSFLEWERMRNKWNAERADLMLDAILNNYMGQGK